MYPLTIGIEVGGTKLQVGVGHPNGNLLNKTAGRVNPANGAAGIRQSMIGLVDNLLTSMDLHLSDITTIGIGFGGPVDSKHGIILNSFQIDGWADFPLKAWAEEQWGLPATIQNDASTAGLAEVIAGNGQGFSRVFYMTIGSGIGGGWIVDGHIDDGQGQGAAEIGHMWVPHPENGTPTELELVCSGWSIGQRAQALAADEPTGMLKQARTLANIDAKVVYAAAAQGDRLANRVLDETCQTLGLALGNVVSLLHPERIIIGGGVSLMGDLFWNNLRRQTSLRMMPLFAPRVDLVQAKLGEDVVLVGALCLG